MGVYKLHLVLETLGDTGDHVGDHGLDGSQTSNVLSVTVPNGESSLETLGGLDLYFEERKHEQSETWFRFFTMPKRLMGRQAIQVIWRMIGEVEWVVILPDYRYPLYCPNPPRTFPSSGYS